MWFQVSYTLLGAMGMFFFGMKILSESLQALSGDVVRRSLRLVGSNRLLAVLAGIVLTALVLSSSLSTVMVVGLVNAKLMPLSQAIGVIFGANIGTTATAWILALNLGRYGLLLVGFGVLPLLLGRYAKARQVGYLLVSLGLVFLGLEYLNDAFVTLRESEDFLSFIAHFSADGLPSLLACIGAGALLTMLLRSSAAMVALSIALVGSGAVEFQAAVALLLGAEIGTTVTAVIAARGATANARRASLAHVLFNVACVVVVLPFFYSYVNAVDALMPGDPNVYDALGHRPAAGAHIACAQTLFSVVGTFVFLPFFRALESFVVWLMPEPAEKEIPHLKYLKSAVDMEAPSLALAMAERELANMAEITGRAVDALVQYIEASAHEARLLEKILRYEEITDAIQLELTIFLCRVQQARLTDEQSQMAYALIRASDELESVADYCGSTARALARMQQGSESFTAPAQEDLLLYARSVARNYHALETGLAGNGEPLRLAAFEEERTVLGHEGDRLREQHRRRIESGSCSAIAGMVFTDAMVGLRKLKGHTYEVVRALAKQA
jgi:phosphate:Na+ symporter